MNSDPHDSTAWRSFGMLDSNESAGFDDAMRHDPELKAAAREMDRISTALALATSHPIAPRADHLERIQSRLHLHRPRGMPIWIGIAGWAAAATLALLLVWNADGFHLFPSQPAATAAAPSAPKPQAPATQTAQDPAARVNAPDTKDTSVVITKPSSENDAGDFLARRETAQFTQEIAALQEQIKALQERESALAQAHPGVALPVIMKMSPPGTPLAMDASLALNDSPIALLLGETSRTNQSVKQPTADVMGVAANVADPALPIAPDANADATTTAPAAIPIYDAARDAGTLVVTNLPAALEGMEYNLWVETARDAPPVRLGILPNAGTSPSESFDFSLGSNRVLPSGFFLTQDPKDQPTSPNEKNTVLQSPQKAEQ